MSRTARTARTLTSALILLALLPGTTAAQDIEPIPIEPRPIVPCDLDCWWPVGSIAQLDGIEADIDVADGRMISHYRFELSNPVPRGGDVVAPSAEGRIVFPVPSGSSVTDLVLSGGPETLEGRLLDADEATRIYEDIVRRLIDPALLRSLEGDLYEVRAFPVPAGEEREVSFTVTTPLLAEGEEAVVEVPWSRMSPRPADAVVTVDVDVPWEVRSALAPGFDLDSDRSGEGELAIGWESTEGWTPDADFRLHLGGGDGLVATRLLAHRERGEDGYFALLFAPEVAGAESVDRDIVVVLDTSGSMEGEKFSQAIDAAVYVLEHLGEGDRFGIVDFARRVHRFSDELRPAADAEAGIEYLRDLAPGGNTNISGALDAGLSLLDGERPGTVIFLTDGLPTAGIEDSDGILELAASTAPDRTQLFAFGVGYDVDTVLLDALSTQHVGTSHYVTPDERIDTEVQRLYEQVSTPVLTDVEISIEGVDTYDLAPEVLPGIFAGNQALLTGRYDGDGPATVVVTGDSSEGPERFEYEVELPERDGDDPAIAQLWAQRRVADLLTELRIEGTRESLVEEIVDIATRFGIVTPYTAYLAEEPELAFDRDVAQRTVDEFAAAAPASGEQAVKAADDLERLREGRLELGTTGSRVVGAHSFYLVDGTWFRDDHEEGTDAPEVEVGSPEFSALLEAAPEIAEAAALGERVVTEGPDGWVTIVWPEAGTDGA
jgi:Ca-activated chloride channel family protein